MAECAPGEEVVHVNDVSSFQVVATRDGTTGGGEMQTKQEQSLSFPLSPELLNRGLTKIYPTTGVSSFVYRRDAANGETARGIQARMGQGCEPPAPGSHTCDALA